MMAFYSEALMASDPEAFCNMVLDLLHERQWRVSRLASGASSHAWPGRSSIGNAVAERAPFLAILTKLKDATGQHLLVFCDNLGILSAAVSGRSSVLDVNSLLIMFFNLVYATGSGACCSAVLCFPGDLRTALAHGRVLVLLAVDALHAHPG